MITLRRFITLVSLCLCSALLAACIQPIRTTSAAVANNPNSAFDAFHTALNAHDANAALAFFAEDATIQLPGNLPPSVYKGKSEIGSWLEGLAAQHIQVEITSLQVKGDTLTYNAKVDIDALRPLSISLDGPAELTVQQGKITALTHTLNQETRIKLIFTAFNATVNEHEVDKALSFFADDATVQFPNQPPPNIFKGAMEIRTWLENDAKDNIHVEIENTQTSGDTVSAIAKVDVDSLPPDLMLVGTVEVTIKNDKITAFSYTLDEETLAKLAALAPK